MTVLMDPISQYMLLMAVTIFFTTVALNRNSITFHFLAAFSWFAAALGHLIIGSQLSPLTNALAFFYVGVGLIFTVSSLEKTLSFLVEKKRRIELE